MFRHSDRSRGRPRRGGQGVSLSGKEVGQTSMANTRSARCYGLVGSGDSGCTSGIYDHFEG